MKKKFTILQSRFIESTDPEGKDWDVCIIEKGTSKNGFTYSKELLEQATPLFDGAKACLYEFDNKVLKHLPDSAQNIVSTGFPKNIVGWYSEPKYGEFKTADGTVREGILAKFHISENAKWLRDLMKDAWTHGKNLLGLSIDANATVSESDAGGVVQRLVQAIHKINSVDVVTYPSAGGAFFRLVAADDNGEQTLKIQWEAGMKKYLLKLFEMLSAKKHESVNNVDPKNITEEQGAALFTAAMSTDPATTLKIVEESVKEDTEQATKAAADKVAADKVAADKVAADKAATDKANAAATTDTQKATEAVTAALKEAEKLKEDMQKMACSSLLDSKLAASRLPGPVRDDIRERFNARIFEAKELDGAITKSMDMLAKLSESGDVRNVGKTSVEVTLAECEKKCAALDKLIDPKATVADNVKNVGAFRGIKEAYVAFTGDHEVSGKMQPQRLTEAMQSSDFASALGTSMTRKMAKDYPLYPTTWQEIANVVPIANFKTQDTIRWGGFGRLPVVAEKGSYTDLYGPKDEKVSYTPSKKGGLAYVTREMILNDDLRFLQRLPGALSRAAAETLEYYVWKDILSNAVCYDMTALGTVDHANYATTALSDAALTAAKVRMRKQTGRGSVIESGTATGTLATTTVEDSSKAWTTNAYAGKYVRFTAYQGAGEVSLIASNTATVLTFATVTTAPEVGTTFEITAADSVDAKLGLKPRILACGPDLESTALIIRNSSLVPGGVNNDVNIHKDTFDIVQPLWLTDATDWFMFADKNLIDIVEVGFVGGQETPALMIQDQPVNGYTFTNDQIVYKVRHEYGYAIVDYRGIDVNIVAG